MAESLGNGPMGWGSRKGYPGMTENILLFEHSGLGLGWGKRGTQEQNLRDTHTKKPSEIKKNYTLEKYF